jgi:hypothetical protein
MRWKASLGTKGGKEMNVPFFPRPQTPVPRFPCSQTPDGRKKNEEGRKSGIYCSAFSCLPAFLISWCFHEPRMEHGLNTDSKSAFRPAFRPCLLLGVLCDSVVRTVPWRFETEFSGRPFPNEFVEPLSFSFPWGQGRDYVYRVGESV